MPRKAGILIFLILLSSALLAFSPLTTFSDESKPVVSQSGTPPAPEFVSISPEKTIYAIGEAITVEYRADRFEVDGVVIVGEGSNLSLNPENSLNMTLKRSYREYSYYSITFNVTSFTKFWAWAWSGSITNGTAEALEPFAHGDKAHYIFVEGQQMPPSLKEVIGGEQDLLHPTEYYVPQGNQVTIRYEIINSTGNETLYIAFSTNKTLLYNDSVTLPESTDPNNGYILFEREMTLKEYIQKVVEPDVSIYEFNVTLNTRMLYFAARNDIGWEIDQTTLDPRVNILTNGFSFNSTVFDENFTESDTIAVNITAYNASSYDSFMFRYRIYENLTTDEPSNWTDIALTTPLDQYVSNITGWNTTVVVYNVTLGPFEPNKTIEYQAYVKYLGDTQNESRNLLQRFSVVPSTPYGHFTLEDKIYTNAENFTLLWSAGSFKGDVTNITLLVNGTLEAIILGEENYTLLLPSEGIYLLELNVTNSLNISAIVDNMTLVVDRTVPLVSFIGLSNDSTYTSGDIIRIRYSDNSTFWDSGIEKVIVDWGDGIITVATNQTEIQHSYLIGGSYNITITAFDKAGNNNSVSITVTVTPVSIPTSTKEEAPLSVIPFLLGLFVLSAILVVKKRR